MSVKYHTVAAAVKVDLLKRYDAENMKLLSQRKAAEKLGIKPTTLNRWLKTRPALERTASSCDGNRKRHREGKCPAVDEALKEWFSEASLSDEPITRTVLLKKAREIAKELSVDFKASDGWLTRWRERFGISKKDNEEKAYPGEPIGERWLNHTWQNVLDNYPPEYIYNVDETALYYKATPVDALGHRKSNECMTILLACNMTGSDKLMPVVIGKTEKPKCLEGMKYLPVEYRSNENSWLTRPIFADFLKNWNSALKEKIALLLHDTLAHPVLKLSNIELIFLPSYADTLGLPLQQGVIQSWKYHYRTIMRRKIADEIEMNPTRTVCDVADRLTIMDAIVMVAEAWDKVTPDFIASCFDYELKPIREDVKEWDREMDFWLKMDDDIETCETITNRKKQEIFDDERSDRETKSVTRHEMRTAMNILWRFMTQRKEGGEFETIYKLNDLMEKSFGIPKVPCKLSDLPIS